MLKPTPLLLLLVTALVGCNSLGYGDYQRSRRADNRGYANRRAADRSYPDWARVNSGGRAAYVVCHKDKKTKTVRTSSVRGHLNHGDRFGSCRSDRRARNGNRGYRDQRRARARHDRDRRGRRYDDRRHNDGDDDDD